MKFQARLVLLTRSEESPAVVHLHYRLEGSAAAQMIIPASPEVAYGMEFGALYSFEPMPVVEHSVGADPVD